MLPFLIMLLLAVFEIGRALLHYNTLQKNLRDAARYLASAAANHDTEVIDLTPELVATARNLVVYGMSAGGSETLLPGLQENDVTVSSPDALHVQVTVTYTYVPLFAVIPTFGMTAEDLTVPTDMTTALTMRTL